MDAEMKGLQSLPPSRFSSYLDNHTQVYKFMDKINTTKGDKCVTSKIEFFRGALGYQKGRAVRMKVAFQPGVLQCVGISIKAQ